MTPTDLFGQQPPLPLPEVPGYDSHWLEEVRGYRIVVPDGELVYAQAFLDRALADRCVEYFQENDRVDWRTARWRDVVDPDDLERIVFRNIRWKQDRIRLYGRTTPLPRLTAWYGDSGRTYTYSGITSTPNEWNDRLLDLKRRVEAVARTRFNSVLLNWYRDGSDHLGWHADDEVELGRNPVIASVNFGETRDFVLRRKDDRTTRLVLPLGHGTLLLMRGALQHHWEHAVPKRARSTRSRFNLTFRRIIGPVPASA